MNIQSIVDFARTLEKSETSYQRKKQDEQSLEALACLILNQTVMKY
jgi:hypothetical protein